MSDHSILESKAGEQTFLLGNEAIARGAIEAGVGFATAYPGTPASEIGDALSDVAQKAGLYFEYSVNEKVALEMAAAAAASKIRSLVSMKHVGLNVASDPFMTTTYTGTRSGLVIVSAGDPSQHSSQNEQDNRYYACLSDMPMLEPSDPQEAYEITKYAFDLSEELELPILLVTTTRLSHSRGIVTVGELPIDVKKRGHFEKNPGRFVVVPQVGRKRHQILLKQIKKAEQISEDSEFNKVIGEGNTGVVTSGISFNYVIDAISDLDIEDRVSVLKLSMTHPIPERLCKSFLKSVDQVLVVEEMTPYLENEMRVYIQELGIDLRVFGKRTKHLPEIYEYRPDLVKKTIAEILDIDYEKPKGVKYPDLPERPPVLCPGCPHRATYYAVKSVAGDDAIFPSDIGCYSLGLLPPLNAADFMLCMGSSVGTAGGFSKTTPEKVVAFIGDSTFFHSGIPPLVNAVHNRSNFTLVVLDNRTTAMTGHQPHPGIDFSSTGEEVTIVSLEEVVKGCGVEFVRKVSPLNLDKATKAISEALEFEGVSVVISQGICPLMEGRPGKRSEVKEPVPLKIDQEVCTNCRTCIEKFMCPAFYIQENEVNIDESLCNGCGVCVQVCPLDAIKPVGKSD